jgi:Ca2+-binding RTX toxin-like protein
MAANFTRTGQEVQVNAAAVDRSEFDADIAALTDGRFAVVNTRALSNDDWDINLQFLNADGTLSGERLLIDNDVGIQQFAAVAPRLGGGAVVAWTDVNGRDAGGNPLNNAVEIMVVGSTGVMANPLTVAQLGAAGPDVALLADGRVLVVWQHQFGANFDVLLRVLDADGSGLGAIKSLESDNAIRAVTPAIAASGNKALVAFEEEFSGDIRVELFDGESGEFTMPGTPGRLVANVGSLTAPDVAALNDGRYIVVWENESNGRVEGRFVDASGTTVSATTLTIADTAGANETPRVAALPDGGFIVTWRTTGGVIAPEDGGDYAVLGRRFDSTGAAAGDLFLVNTGDPETSQYAPAVAVHRGSGNAFIAWTDDHVFSGAGQDNQPPGIRGRAFAPTTDVVNGTDAGDAITTYSLSETINGLAGNDTVIAMGGNDAVDGGEGSDLLFGGIGDDALAGGEGADTINGEDGADLINGGPGNDGLSGGPGPDRFMFNTAIKKKASNVDTIADFSAADDTILLDNAIFKKLKTEGVLKAKFFEAGKKAKSGKDTIIYNDKNGTLVYDKNGDKKGGALLFARLEGSPDDVSAADFLVI